MARRRRGSWDGGWAPYVRVADRRHQATRLVERLRKQGHDVSPVEIEGRKITRTFWGSAWCDNLESFSDYANRLPRGRRYVRNGSVIDLQIDEGRVTALVSGSEIYEVDVSIDEAPEARWRKLVSRCTGKIDSVVELLSGRLANGVMEVLASPEGGLFPKPREIRTGCNCPDYARMCKHIAAVLYGIGARLDHEPELLFVLRQVDSLDLVAEAGASSLAQAPGDGETIAEDELADLFGIDLDEGALQAERPPRQEEGAVATTAGADVQPLLDTLTRPTLLRLCEAFELDPGRGYAKRGRLVELLAEGGPADLEGLLGELLRAELERACAKLGLATSGRRKAVLVDRLREALGG